MRMIFDKLNLKDQKEILVMNAPSSFESELAKLKGVTIRREARKMKSVDFALVFVITQAEVDAVSKILAEKMNGDAILWFAYPKGTSKKYACEFNRDNGWDVIRGAGFDTVRAVAIDEDWSALRFRRTQFIRSGVGSRRKN